MFIFMYKIKDQENTHIDMYNKIMFIFMYKIKDQENSLFSRLYKQYVYKLCYIIFFSVFIFHYSFLGYGIGYSFYTSASVCVCVCGFILGLHQGWIRSSLIQFFNLSKRFLDGLFSVLQQTPPKPHSWVDSPLQSNIFFYSLKKLKVNLSTLKYYMVSFLLGLLIKKPFDYFIYVLFSGYIADLLSLILTVAFVLIVSFTISNMKGLEYKPLIAIAIGVFSWFFIYTLQSFNMFNLGLEYFSFFAFTNLVGIINLIKSIPIGNTAELMLIDTGEVKSPSNVNIHKLPLYVTADRDTSGNGEGSSRGPSQTGASGGSSQAGASTGGTFGLNTGQYPLSAWAPVGSSQAGASTRGTLGLNTAQHPLSGSAPVAPVGPNSVDPAWWANAKDAGEILTRFAGRDLTPEQKVWILHAYPIRSTQPKLPPLSSLITPGQQPALTASPYSVGQQSLPSVASISGTRQEIPEHLWKGDVPSRGYRLEDKISRAEWLLKIFEENMLEKKGREIKNTRSVLGIEGEGGGRVNIRKNRDISDINRCYKEFIEDYLKDRNIKHTDFRYPKVFHNHLKEYIESSRRS